MTLCSSQKLAQLAYGNFILCANVSLITYLRSVTHVAKVFFWNWLNPVVILQMPPLMGGQESISPFPSSPWKSASDDWVILETITEAWKMVWVVLRENPWKSFHFSLPLTSKTQLYSNPACLYYSLPAHSSWQLAPLLDSQFNILFILKRNIIHFSGALKCSNNSFQNFHISKGPQAHSPKHQSSDMMRKKTEVKNWQWKVIVN